MCAHVPNLSVYKQNKATCALGPFYDPLMGMWWFPLSFMSWWALVFFFFFGSFIFGYLAITNETAVNT